MRSLITFLSCLLLLLPAYAAAQGLYTIIAPNTLRPNSQFHVAVSIHKSVESARFKVGILGSTYTDFKTVELRPYSTQLLHFELPALKSDNYKLTVEGLSGIQFTNETQLHFEPKEHTVLIQTDKSIYKPGDLMHYRILLLDANLKPARGYGRVHVEIKDSGNNLIRSYQDIRLTNAIYSNELQLSDYPRFGDWLINVQVGDQQHHQTFEILDHILPKFVVDIETPRKAIYKDGKIAATIKAHYAFGQPIVGEATLSIYPTFFGSLQPFVNDLITRKVVPIDGRAYFEFDIEQELHLKQDYERQYLLDALVEERSTGSVQNYSTVLTLYLNHFRVETIKLPSYYIPGVPFEATARIARNDGSSLRDFKPEITAYLTNVYGSSEMYNRSSYNLDARGEVKMKFTVPVGDRDEYHSIIVDYLGVISEVGKVPRKHMHSSNYITAKVLNDKAIVNQEISVAVLSNQPMKYFMYQIVGRGDIILSRTVDVADNSFHTIKFLASFAMMPRAKLLVYMVVNGEFVYDEQVIQFEENLLNAVQIEAPFRAPPGQDIDIAISTKPYSYVGLMVVDQNAAALGSGNDLTHDRLMNALYSYELSDVNTLVSSPGKESGAIIMSNTDYFVEKEAEATPAIGRETSSTMEDDKLTAVRKTDIGPAHKIEVNTLPPGKGRYAFSYTPKPYWHNPRVHVMRDPANTWLFLNISASSDGRNTLHRRIPSDMTSWHLTAFSLDPVNGLGLSVPNTKLEAYKEFHIATDLPYSIRKDELIAIPFVVHNNRDSDLSVDVTFYNTAQDFDFPQLDSKQTNKPKVELYSRRTIQVPGKSARSISFIVTPRRVGALPVKAVASTSIAGDTVEQTLLVEHSGATERVNRGFLFELNSNAQRKQNVTIKVPRNAIPDSSSIEVKAVGDLMGSIVGNLQQLILLPTGCGEQTMVNFVPNLMVLRYLGRLRQLTPALELSAMKNLAVGYQRLLYYRHENGAFSAFGLNAKQGSTWLTAYVARFLRQATPYTQVDDHVLQTAIAYLASMQSGNGGYEEHGDTFEQFDDGGISLTAFVTLAIMENVDVYPEYRNHINKALDFITRSLDASNNLHAMALGTYVLSRANHNAKAAFLQHLDSLAINADGRKWWNKTAPANEHQSPWYNATRSVNIEISAYAAMALLENNLVGDALPVLNWLMDQRNENGGFVASQDTVVGLQALLMFAERFSSQGNNVQIGFHYGEGAETILNVNSENSLALQSVELPNNVKNISVSATGRGMALAQVSYKYNTNVTSAWPRFVLDPTVNRNSHADYLHLSACTSFVSVPGDAERSNMAVMEINLPSGFVVDTDTLPTLESSERIKKVETQMRNTKVVIYFDYLDRREVCPTLHAYKTVKVTKHRPVAVVMYDYYDNARRARQFYRAPKSNICDICERANCGDICEKAEKRESRRPDDYTAIAVGMQAAASGPPSPPQHREKRISRDENRGRWNNKAEFVLSLIGYAVGIGNVWRFPYLCYRSGGGAFLVPYILMVILCGVPLFYMEVIIGQFSGTGCTGMFRLVPLLKGTGICMVIVNMYCVCYYSVIISYPIRMIYYCFWKVVPWIYCNHSWNTPNCTSLDRLQYATGDELTTASDEFFHLEVLRISGSISDIGTIVWEQLLALFITWCIIYLCMVRGIKSVGKVVYCTAPFPYLLLTILFVRGVTLPGAGAGIRFLMYPDWRRLLDLKVWADAAVQMFFGLGPGWGGIVNMASFNNFRNNAKFDTILVVSINVFTSIYAGFVVFAVLGFLSYKSSIPVATVATSGAGLAFVTYPAAIAMMPVPQLWALMFFVMLFILGIDSVFVQLEAICTSLLDEVVYLRSHKMKVTFVLCIIFFTLSSTMCTNGGMYILQLLDWYSSALSVIVICLVEIIMVSYLYGINNFMTDIEFMLGTRPNIFWKISWKFVTPVVLIFILFTSIIFIRTVTYNGVSYPQWAIILGWMTFVSSVISIPLYVLYIMIRKRDTMCDSLKKRLKPLDWTPADPQDRANYNAFRRERKMPAFMSDTSVEPETK